MIEVREQLEQILRDIVVPDLADEAGSHPAALAPVGHRVEREQLVRVVEDRKEEVVVTGERGHAEPGHHRPRQPPRARRQPAELVHPPGEFQRPVVRDFHPVGAGHLGDDVFQLVGQAERDQVVDPAHRELQHAAAAASDQLADGDH
ncbi:MAG: hypothetical protein AUI48_10500 [Chloroflexi bacterium 13_1_40CM_2_68_14]|nr:MAG: hypothetical protein AUI48_10500 [Chloroflexi bacterium 13_1_40CM_2_68_14]